MTKVQTTVPENVSDKVKNKGVSAVQPKKKLTKRVPRTSTPNTKVEVVEKVPKVVKQPSTRKINSKPALSKTTGINISPAKVKNIVSNFVLNKESYLVLKELKEAAPRKITKMVNGVSVVDDFKGTPVAQLSKPTLLYISKATECFEKTKRDEYTKAKISKMTDAQKKNYMTLKLAEKVTIDKSRKEHGHMKSVEFIDDVFNLKFDARFYDVYKTEKIARDTAGKSDEWKYAIDKVTKLKNRFSTNSRVLLSALVECLIKQIATNGTFCCVDDKKKIIQLSHILDTSKPGFEERFPMYPMIMNLDTFKQAKELLCAQSTTKAVKSSATDESTDVVVDEKKSCLFTVDGLSIEKQHQFRYYIGETCREVRMDLASGDGDCKDLYNYTSVSKIFKNFCSSLVCEFLMRIGKMLGKEIETRCIKTVNDTIINTVISQYHIVCGVDESKTTDFIEKASTKYNAYTADRQKNRKLLNNTTSVNGGVSAKAVTKLGDLPYVDK
jgi:hypothetical protein